MLAATVMSSMFIANKLAHNPVSNAARGTAGSASKLAPALRVLGGHGEEALYGIASEFEDITDRIRNGNSRTFGSDSSQTNGMSQ